MVSLYALALLCTDNSILLLRRCNTDFANRLFSLVGGKVEHGETARHAVARETYEEVGLVIPESDFDLVHVFHRKGTETELIALIFKADIKHMSPFNKEPEKHDLMQLFKIDALPENIIPAHKQAIDYIQNNIYYSEHNW